MRDPVLAKLVDLTECSNKIERCLRDLGVSSYGILFCLTRELSGTSFKEAIMSTKTATANPLSEEETGNLLDLHSLTLSTRAGLWEEWRTWMTWGLNQETHKPAKKARSEAPGPEENRGDQMRKAAEQAMDLVLYQ
jgi:hypothetical protein